MSIASWYHPTISSSVTPFSFCLQSFPASESFPMNRLFASGCQSTEASALASVLLNEYTGLISFKIDWFDPLAVQGTLKNLLQYHNSKATILQGSAFFMVQIYIHTWLLEKPLFDYTDFVSKVISLLLNMLFRFVTAFLPRSRCLLISWLSPSTVVTAKEPKKIKPITVSTFSPSIYHEVLELDAISLVFLNAEF